MKIKIWGSRGSIPVPDSRMMKYGGNTTCVECRLDGQTFIIDAGTGIRRLGEELLKQGVSDLDIFITHSHWDHIQGFPFFGPIYSGDTRIRIYGCTNSYKQMKDVFAGQMSYEYFPISFNELKSKISFQEGCGSDRLSRKGYRLSTLRANHPVFTSGLRIDGESGSFVFITDNELAQAKPHTQPAQFESFCRDADLLIHDAQFTDAEYGDHIGWGHSTFEQAISLAVRSGVKRLGFAHHDPNRKDSELDTLEERFRGYCSKKKLPLEVFVVRELQELETGR